MWGARRQRRAGVAVELDPAVGPIALPDLLNELGVAEDTIVVFAGYNGPEENPEYRF